MNYRIVLLVIAFLTMPHLGAYAQQVDPAATAANQVDQMPVADASAATSTAVPAPPPSLSPIVQLPPVAPSTVDTSKLYGPQWPSGQPLPDQGLNLPLNIVPPLPTAAELAYMQAQMNWASWVASQEPSCSAGLDSIAEFNPKSDKVAIIIHGLGSSPQSMMELIQLFKSQGFTVLAPRLNGHFEKNLKALDNISYAKWVTESEQVFELAKGFGSRITVVGHSLGGLLASRLAIKFPDQVERAVLFAPAWRVRTMVAVASQVGSFLQISLNDQFNIPVACKVDQGYVPASSGKQIQSLIDRTETEFGGDPDAGIDNPRASIFARMQVPRIIVTAPEDEAVDSEMIAAACPPLKTGCLDIPIPTAKHTGITKNLNAVSTGKWAHSSIKSILTKFLSLDGRARQAQNAK